MAKFRWLAFIGVLAVLALGLVPLACGGDDDDDDDDNDTDDDVDDDTGDDDTGDDDTGDDDTGDDDTGGESFAGFVVDFLSEVAQEGATVELLDNTTGESFDPPIMDVSDATGYVEFNDIPVEKAYIGVKVTKDGYMMTIQYYFETGTMDATILAVSNTTVNLMAGLLGVTLDDTKGQVAGAVWYEPETGDNEPVGCAEVTTDVENEGVFYFGPSLPDPSRTNTNPANPNWVALNVAPGPVEITGTVDSSEESIVLPKLYENSISITSVYFRFSDGYTENPTPDGCTK